MKINLRYSILLLALGAFAAQGQTTVTRQKANIDRITVYMNSAQYSSKVNGNLTAGINKLVVDDLPSTIDPSSVQVSGMGAFTILSVNFDKDFLKEANKEYKDSLMSINDQLLELNLQKEVLINQQNMLMDNTEVKGEDDALTTDGLEKMTAYFKKKLLEIGKERLTVEKAIAALNETKKRIEQQIAQNPANNTPAGALVLTLKADKATKAAIDLNYVVNNAGWTPVYDIRVASLSKPLEITYKAMVYQNTGADWSNVNLEISTAQINRNNNKPELYPNYLAFYVPRPPVMYKREAAVSLNAARPMADDEMAMEVAGSAADYTVLQENLVNKSYKIGIPYSIKSGGRETVELDIMEVNAEYTTYLVPKYEETGFLTASVTDYEDLNLIPAQANVYIDGGFVGQTYLNTNTKEDKLLISLGRNEYVTATRTNNKEYKARKTFGSNITEYFGYEIEIKNLKNETIKVVVEDQVPISQDSDIEVETIELSNGQKDDQTGKVTWNVELAAKQSKKLQLKYSVKYPKDKTIPNL